LRKKAIRKTPRKPARPGRARKSAPRKARSVVPRQVPHPIRSPAVLIAIIALSGTVILAAMGRARGPETTATDVHLETAAPAEEFVNLPVADAAEPATTKAPAPTLEAAGDGTHRETAARPKPGRTAPAVIATIDAPAATAAAAMVTTATATISVAHLR
jgi:hypothetical protein